MGPFAFTQKKLRCPTLGLREDFIIGNSRIHLGYIDDFVPISPKPLHDGPIHALITEQNQAAASSEAG